MSEPDSFFAEFPTPTSAEWRQAVVESLRGRSFESLITHTDEGIDLLPMLRREDTADIQHQHTLPGQPPYVRGTRAAGYRQRPWLVAQELIYLTPQVFNKVLLHDLEHGQTAVHIRLDQPTRHGRDPDQAQPGEVSRDGLSLATTDDITTALQGVEITNTRITINPGISALPLLALLIAALRKQGLPTADLSGCLAADPLTMLAAEGTLAFSLEQAYDKMAQVTSWAANNAPDLATIAVSNVPYHESGGSAVEELAFAIATGVAYLRAMQERGVTVNTAAQHMRFEFCIGSQFFVEIAKLRAARLLWSQTVTAFGGNEDAQKMQIDGRTARRNKAVFAPYVNILRGTAETLAAALGGIDTFHVSSFDEPIRLPDDFSRRIARNTQIILQEESHLTRLIDPAGGSYAVEYLTDQLARRAWALFQEVERCGGMAAALQAGFPQATISKIAEQRREKFERGEQVLVGVNRYANADEVPLAADDTDYDTLYKERAAQLAAYRSTNSDPTTRQAALDKLGQTQPEGIIEAAIVAAAAGATLNDLARAMHTENKSLLTVTPLSTQKLAVAFKSA